MLKKLQYKIIAINMTLVGVVLIVVFVISGISNYNFQKGLIDKTLDITLKRPSIEMKEPINKREKNGNVLSSLILFDQGTKTISIEENGLQLNEETVSSTVNTIVKDKSNYGYIIDEELYYAKISNGETIKIAIVSGTHLKDNVLDSISISILLFFIAMVGIFLISIQLSKMAIKPIKTTFEKQNNFVADASHELKTPLTVIIANNNIIKNNMDKPVFSQEQWINSTYYEACHMKKLIDELLFLAKVEDREKCDIETINISDLLLGEIIRIEATVYDKNKYIDNNINENIHIKGNSTQIVQLIKILMDNSIKYAYENSTITVELYQEGKYIYMNINNKGEVIPKDSLSLIFDRFYRVDKARTGEPGVTGYGLGLSIAKAIVDNHNGSIKAISDQLNGTTMVVKLPRD
ncbi:MAG: HAMP domain-containing sensor histidine kinase [Bacilli bacterium]